MAALASDIRTKGEPVLFVAGGDLFGPKQPHFRLRATLAAQSLSLMGCDAMTLGEGDFSFGRPFLEEALRTAGIPAVSTNLKAGKGGAGKTAEPPSFSSVIRKDIGGLKVAILGLLDPALFPAAGTGLEATEPVAALKGALAEVRAEVDLVVLLSHLGKQGTIEALEQVPGVDVAVIGHAEEGLDEPLRVGKTVLVANGGSGKTLGYLRVGIAPDGMLHAAGSRLPVSEDITPHPRVKIHMDNYRRGLKKLQPPEWVALADSPFAGTAACKTCHTEAYKIWKESRHAHAFASLRAVSADYDPECVGCHVVGHEQKGGFVRADVTPELVDVGCETCHGPGQKHVDDRGAAKETKYEMPNIRGDCGTCHTQDRNPGFRFAEFWDKIAHEKE